jgi:hypothetical protein
MPCVFPAEWLMVGCLSEAEQANLKSNDGETIPELVKIW